MVGCKLATKLGFEKLRSSGSVVDAVEEAVRSMELDEFFNAGAYGKFYSFILSVAFQVSRLIFVLFSYLQAMVLF